MRKEDKSTDPKHIVIVGEPSDAMKGLGELLEQQGCQVSIAAEGSEELSHIISTNPEAYLLTPLHTANTEWLLSAPTSIKTEKIGVTPQTSRDMLDGDYTEIIGDSPQILKVLTQIDELQIRMQRC